MKKVKFGIVLTAFVVAPGVIIADSSSSKNSTISEPALKELQGGLPSPASFMKAAERITKEIRDKEKNIGDTERALKDYAREKTKILERFSEATKANDASAQTRSKAELKDVIWYQDNAREYLRDLKKERRELITRYNTMVEIVAETYKIAQALGANDADGKCAGTMSKSGYTDEMLKWMKWMRQNGFGIGSDIRIIDNRNAIGHGGMLSIVGR